MSTNLTVLATAIGVVAHHGIFRHGDWHLHGLHVIAGHLALGLTAWAYVVLRTAGTDTDSHAVLTRTAAMSAAYLIGLFSSMTIYRLYFHRVSGFPGPRMAAVTKFWHIWHVRLSTNHYLQMRMYEEYGPLVRTGPNEITIFDASAFELLDGHGNECSKDVWYDIIRPRESAIFTRDGQAHREGRRVWSKAFSTKSMSIYYPRIAKLAQALSDNFGTYEDQPVDLDTAMSCFSFDAMGEVMFGQDFNLTKSMVMIPAIKHRDRALALAGLFTDAIWIAMLGFQLLPFYGRIKDWHRMMQFCEDHMMARLKSGQQGAKLDVASFLIDDYHNKASVKSKEQRDALLGGEAVTAIVAGSDTTRVSLMGMMWYLCKYPEHAKRIQAEVENVDVNDVIALGALPHLDGVIQETLRLIPPVLTGNARITGPNGLLVGDVLIPPGTKVSSPRYVIHRMESCWVQPNDFIPERWYSRPELIKDKRAFAPFAHGVHTCLGKSMAYAELRLVTAILLKKYDVSFAPGYDEVTIWRDMKDQVTCQPGEVTCVFKTRH